MLTFRPEGYPLWYQIAMRRDGPGFVAVLPKPRPSARRIYYMVEVYALGRARERGQQLSAPVVEEAKSCPGTPADVNAWVKTTKLELVAMRETGRSVYEFYIRKR